MHKGREFTAVTVWCLLSCIISAVHPLKVAPALSDCFPVSDHDNHLYIFYISDATGGLYLSQPMEEEQQLSFGILCSKTLPHLQVSMSFKCWEVSICTILVFPCIKNGGFKFLGPAR